MKTKVFIENFKGHNIFGVFEVDSQGDKLEPQKGPIVSFGVKKAAVLLSHKDDLEKFVASNQPSIPTDNPAIDISKLSPEQQAQIAAILTTTK